MLWDFTILYFLTNLTNMLFENDPIDPKSLFLLLYNAGTEEDVQQIIDKHTGVFENKNWGPIGNNESNYGIIENQQANPIAALVEKVTNSMDALLTKKCLEAGINPESELAPASMSKAITRFYPDHKQWDLPTLRRKQAEEIQVIAV
jgi:hypothetical protein